MYVAILRSLAQTLAARAGGDAEGTRHHLDETVRLIWENEEGMHALLDAWLMRLMLRTRLLPR